MDLDGIVREQFRKDTNCIEEDVRRIYINTGKKVQGARYFGEVSDFFRAIIYRGTLYMLCDESIYGYMKDKYADCDPEWFCKFENLREVDRKLNEYGYEIMDTHIYYLPDDDFVGYDFECPYDTVWLDRKDIEKIRGKNPFRHALVYCEGCPDEIAVAAKDKKGRMIAMAGISSDSEYLWQIGADVLNGYAHNGLAVYLTTLLKERVLSEGKIPFYGTSESHSISSRVAVRSGFMPAWCEVYSKKLDRGSKSE